jgi:hypothetical protein
VRGLRTLSFLFAVAVAQVAMAATPRYPLTLGGPNGRSLIDQNGQPFLLWGDSVWSLVAQATLAEAQQYLDDRRGKGFNTVLVNLLEHKFASRAPANRDGVAPFTGRPFATPNAAYFASADAIISAASSRNMLVLLVPLYLGYQCGDEGWCAEVMAATDAELTSWGQYLGNRYKGFDNLLWVMGADTDPTPVAAKVRKVVEGIRAFDTRHLMTAHNQRGTLATTPWPNESWLTVNDVYTPTATQYLLAQTAYQRTPIMPFFLIEGLYEHGTMAPQQALRAQAYWVMLSGAMGHVFGSCPLWDFGFSNSLCQGTDWVADLNGAGSLGMSHAQRLFASRPWYDLMPDTGHAAVTAGYGTSGDASYATVGRASDGATVVAYLPTSRTLTVNMASVSGTSAAAWWYEPATGAATSIGTFAPTGSRTFTPPASGDWVFVLDDAARGFAAPGVVSTAVPAASWAHLAAVAALLFAAGRSRWRPARTDPRLRAFQTSKNKSGPLSAR